MEESLYMRISVRVTLRFTMSLWPNGEAISDRHLYNTVDRSTDSSLRYLTAFC